MSTKRPIAVVYDHVDGGKAYCYLRNDRSRFVLLSVNIEIEKIDGSYILKDEKILTNEMKVTD